MSEQPAGGRYEVYIRRDREGKFVGFTSSVSRGRFISRQEAMSGLRLDFGTGELIDARGERVGIGSIAFPRAGVEVRYISGITGTVGKIARYERLTTLPERFTPRPDQEIVERITVVTPDGRIRSVETSYGLGGKYDPEKRGGWWRKATSEALGVKEGERLPTRDLERAVLRREILVKTFRNR